MIELILVLLMDSLLETFVTYLLKIYAHSHPASPAPITFLIKIYGLIIVFKKLKKKELFYEKINQNYYEIILLFLLE